MRILILSWRDITHPLAGGAEQVTHEHAKAWVKAGHDVTVFTSFFPGANRKETLDRINFIRKGFELLIVQISALVWYLWGHHPKFDLVVDQFHGIPFLTPIYVRTRRLAVIQEVAKEVWLMNHLPRPLNLIVGTIGYLTEPFIYLLYRKTPFLTGSQSAKSDLINFGIPEKNIFIIHHGIKVVRLKAIPKKEKRKTIIFFGALTRDKGIEDAIRVFGLLKKKDDSYYFWVVGKGNGRYFDSLVSLAHKLGLKNSIKFWGYVDDRKKFELLARSHVLIHTSAREGWGLNVIEANYVGTSVVGYNVPGLKDSIKTGINGYLVTYKNLKSMTEKIDNFLNNKKLVARLNDSSQNYARQFKWKKAIKKSLELIRKISRKRILILNWKDIYHPEAGGAEVVTLEHAKAWIKDYEVTWFSSSFPNTKPRQVVSGIEIVRQGSQILGVHILAPFFYFETGPYDLVVDQFHGIPFFTPIFVRTKKLAFIHEVAKEVWRLNPWPKPFNLIPWFFGSLFEPLIFKVFYTKVPFLTVSESTKDDLIKWAIPEKNIKVIPNGLNSIKINKRKENRKTAIYLGALARDKGVEDAIDTFALINQRDPSWQFWVVGKGDKNYTNYLISKSQTLGLNKNLKFWGYVTEKKKFELLVRAYVMINPSIREGWGLVNLEANAMGVPVVAYDVPGCRDSILPAKTGYLVKLKDINEIAKAIMRLVNDSDLYKEISKNAILWSKKFTWQRSAKESLKLINSLTS